MSAGMSAEILGVHCPSKSARTISPGSGVSGSYPGAGLWLYNRDREQTWSFINDNKAMDDVTD